MIRWSTLLPRRHLPAGAHEPSAKVAGPKICAINFWPTFSLESGFVKYLLEQALGAFAVVTREADADLVISSVFVRRPPTRPEKTITFIWENRRPDYRLCRFSVSPDFDSYGGRNCRVPTWHAALAWPGLRPEHTAPDQSNHNFEPLIDIDAALRPRPSARASDRPAFCCFVAGNAEPHRMLAVERLGMVGTVDLFGNIAGKPLRSSKLDTLPRYRFNLCFENSAFPGYYTEKPLHAWAAGCVPLYYADPWLAREFNPRALVNRLDSASLDDFVRRVAAIEASPEAIDNIVREPLLLERPTLEPAIDFLKRACANIIN